jgi:hypothetical protein
MPPVPMTPIRTTFADDTVRDLHSENTFRARSPDLLPVMTLSLTLSLSSLLCQGGEGKERIVLSWLYLFLSAAFLFT